MGSSLILGYYGAGNWGDEASLAGVLAGLAQELPQLSIKVLSQAPAQTEALHKVEAVPRQFRALRQADHLILGGGTLLQDVTSPQSLYYYLTWLYRASQLEIPVIWYGQGLGPFRWPGSARLVAGAAKRTEVLTLRDPASLRLLASWKVQGQLAADPALALDPPTGVSASRAIGVAIRPWGPPHWQAPLLEGLRGLGPLRFFAFGAEDRNLAQEFLRQLPEAELAPEASTLAALWEDLASCRGLVASRLHALILGAMAGLPAVGLCYDPKVQAFGDLVGLPVLPLAAGAEVGGALEQVSGAALAAACRNLRSLALSPAQVMKGRLA